jgi:hypothetical protein
MEDEFSDSLYLHHGATVCDGSNTSFGKTSNGIPSRLFFGKPYGSNVQQLPPSIHSTGTCYSAALPSRE